MTHEHDDDTNELDRLALERDVAGLTRHSRKLLGEIKKWRDRARAAESGPKPPASTPWEKFWAEAERRVLGLEGDTRKAELDKINLEAEAMVSSEIGRHQQGLEDRTRKLSDVCIRIGTDRQATALALRLAKHGCATVLQPLLRDRITVALRDNGELDVTYRNAAGATVPMEALEFELRNDASLAPLIEGSSAADKEAHAKRVAETLGQTRH